MKQRGEIPGRAPRRPGTRSAKDLTSIVLKKVRLANLILQVKANPSVKGDPATLDNTKDEKRRAMKRPWKASLRMIL